MGRRESIEAAKQGQKQLGNSLLLLDSKAVDSREDQIAIDSS
jgi:hypothetical protein